MRGVPGEKERGGWLCCLNLIHPRGKLVGVSVPLLFILMFLVHLTLYVSGRWLLPRIAR